MSMEFFAWPWMESMFDDADKYRLSHLEGTIKFLPYGVAVDEFQEGVYANPEMTHEERCAMWREIEKKYLPIRNYKGAPFLEKVHSGSVKVISLVVRFTILTTL